MDSNDIHWYKDAIFYELNVRSFYDGNNDGIGDFRGMIEKIDYIHRLGVNCVWLLPFFPSPLKDDGYDVADFYNVHPDLGTLEDIETFITEAHARGIKVIADMVFNHVSNTHPWFQEARASRTSPKRDWFVWSDNPNKYADARIIFVDSEVSNWTWDDTAQQYYWHRFFHHQPDLNFDNPEVRTEIQNVLRFWLDLGLDGFRCDAVPYLYEREGSSCENLPETHVFFKEVRAMIDEEYPGKILLAEANQWPTEAIPYFGEGDEFHMAFNFPLMPRMFISLAREYRDPITEILKQTKKIPENCQWATFLRNHDELTLEMVTDEERDLMWGEYAKHPKMRINLGIRRRLAPLVDKDRATIELLYGLLFSLPGSPVIYYGDEMGMGDNIGLGDRNGVRTPMQWSSDKNAGFSTEDPEHLYLPPVTNSLFHYETINVRAEERLPTSLLNWVKQIIRLHQSSKVFGRGSLHIVEPDNKKVFAYVRSHEHKHILCVFNLSRAAQHATLDLSKYAGYIPVEMFGNTGFPEITKDPYAVTLPERTFFWFRLEKEWL